MMTYFTSAKVNHLRGANGIPPKRRSRKRLTNFSVDKRKIRATVKKITVAFKDHECILNAWNSLPSLFDFRGKIEKLIDAKYLAAIQKLNFIQTSDLQLSEVELYYTWLLFQFENGQLPTALFSLEDFWKFQQSWRLLSANGTHIISPDDQNDMELAEQKYDPQQLKIDLGMNTVTKTRAGVCTN